MPELPSGKRFALSRNHIVDKGEKWFKAPKGHFWYWVPDKEIMGDAPYGLYDEVFTMLEHSKVPKTSKELQKYIEVFEARDDGKFSWAGEYLDTFPKYQNLSEEDLTAWNKWFAQE